MDGLELREARHRIEASQDDLARVLGYGSGARISEMECNRRKIPVMMALLLEAFNDGWRPKNWHQP